MSSYERWTVYPLLLLILGIVLKDKLLRSVDAQSIVCRNLSVVDAQGNPVVRIGATPDHAGLLDVFGAKGNVGQVRVHDENGKMVGGLPAPVLLIPVRAVGAKPQPPPNPSKDEPPADKQSPNEAPRDKPQQQPTENQSPPKP